VTIKQFCLQVVNNRTVTEQGKCFTSSAYRWHNTDVVWKHFRLL